MKPGTRVHSRAYGDGTILPPTSHIAPHVVRVKFDSGSTFRIGKTYLTPLKKETPNE